MMLANIGVFSLQAAVVILAGLLLPRLLRVARPLVFLQGVLGVVLLLPVLQSWERPVIMAVPVAAGRVVLPAAALERVGGRVPVDWAMLGVAVLGLGVLGRVCWLVAGLGRLREMRMYAEPVAEGLAVSHEIDGPVTFGFWRPVVLVPPSVMTMTEEARAAILAHERAHIRRRDWLYVLVEEVILCGLWFHPAVWLLVGQIRLEREKVVDAEACRESGSRAAYVGALLAVAGAPVAPCLAPPFLRRRQLAARIQSLMEEVPMPGLQSTVRYTAMVVMFLTAGVAVTRLYPLRGQPQVVAATPDGVTVEGAEVVFSTRPVYPMAARRAGVAGPVTLALTLAANGEVSDARVVSGAEELRKAALDAVLHWQFKPGGGAARVTIEFRAEPMPAGTAVTNFFIDEKMPSGMAAALRARLKPYEGQPYTDEIHAVARSVSPTLKIRAEQTASGGVSETAVFIGPSLVEATVPGRIRISGAIQAANLIYKPEPNYPPLARQARIQGTVRFSLVIDKSGGVSFVEVVAGHPLLIPAAMEAVKQYRYQAAKVDEKPVEVATQADVTFSL